MCWRFGSPPLLRKFETGRLGRRLALPVMRDIAATFGREVTVESERELIKMSGREALYLGLAILGLAVTWWFNLLFMIRGGSWVDLPAVMSLAFANPIASSFSADLLVAFATFVVWSVAEARRIDMRCGWLYPLLGLIVAFAFAFPLFLFMRERRLRAEGMTG